MSKSFASPLNLVTLSMLAVLSVLMSQPAAQASTANLFELTEQAHLASGATVQLAAKCGAGSCGGKTEKPAKDATHSCGSKEKGHSCGSKDKTHSCGAKDKEQSCGSKDKTHSCGAHAKPAAAH